MLASLTAFLTYFDIFCCTIYVTLTLWQISANGLNKVHCSSRPIRTNCSVIAVHSIVFICIRGRFRALGFIFKFASIFPTVQERHYAITNNPTFIRKKKSSCPAFCFLLLFCLSKRSLRLSDCMLAQTDRRLPFDVCKQGCA